VLAVFLCTDEFFHVTPEVWLEIWSLADPRIYTLAFKVIKICHIKWHCGSAPSQLNSVLDVSCSSLILNDAIPFIGNWYWKLHSGCCMWILTKPLIFILSIIHAVMSHLHCPCWFFNPLPVKFKTLLHGQKGCIFSAGI